MDDNKVVLFEQQSLALMQQLSEQKHKKEQIEAADAEVRKKLQQAMDQYGIVSFKNELVTISNIPASETTTVDLKKLQEKEPECYQGLIEDYPKVTKKAGYVRILVK